MDHMITAQAALFIVFGTDAVLLYGVPVIPSDIKPVQE